MVACATICVMEMTVEEAAAALGVTRRQVQRLARSGHLQVVARVGTAMLIDSSGLWRAQTAQRGRVLAVRTAWAAIDILESGDTQRLAGSSLSRLRRNLGSWTATDFVRLARGRATVWRGTQTRRGADALREVLHLSGQALVAADEAIASRLDLSVMVKSQIEGYVTAERWDDVQARFGLVAHGEGEVVIRCSPEPVTAGLITTCLDLAENGGTRERSAALRTLDEMLDDL